MIVLGIDTATQATVVGLRMADGSTLQARDDPSAQEHPGHATRLLQMAATLLAEAEIGWRELQRVAVGIGPGRFTGLRVGIATARGLAQSLGVELAGVSSLQALGLAAARHEPQAAILAVIDARRREAFAAAYPRSSGFARERAANEPPAANEPAAADAPPGANEPPSADELSTREIAFPRALAADDLQGIVAELQRRGAPRGERWLAVGDGALCFAQQLARAGARVAPDDSPLHRVDARAICELGESAAPLQAPEQVLPDYRRSPDAALARTSPLAVGGAAS